MTKIPITDHTGRTFENIDAMCKFWKISQSTYYKYKKEGRTLEEILDKTAKKKHVDHKGNVFDSITEMCNFWGIRESNFYMRRKRGVPLAENLESKDILKIRYIDHKGNEFKNINEMATFWKIKTCTLSARLRKGMSIEEALAPVTREVTDHKGIIYANMKEMCKHYNIARSTVERRLKDGHSLEEALTMPSTTRKTFTDHKGNKFKTFGNMCKYWKMPDSTVQNRLYKLNYTLERALTEPTKTQNRVGKTCYDHKGNMYESIATMCCAYGIPRNVYHRRRKDGWDLEKSLTTPPSRKNGQGRKIYDHKGNAYTSVAEMCNAYHIDFAMYGSRIRQGYSLKDALETPPEEIRIGKKECIDHEGNHFKSQAEMMRHWGVTKDQLRSRIELGWTLEQILTTPARLPHKRPYTDHTGKTWPSLEEMLAHYKVNPMIFKRRLNVMHLSLEEALTATDLHKVKCEDHLGNKFETIEEMCLYWNVKPNMYHHRTKKLNWDIHKTLTYIPKPKKFGDNITVLKQLEDYYYLVKINNDEIVWSETKLYEHYRNTNNIPKPSMNVA